MRAEDQAEYRTAIAREIKGWAENARRRRDRWWTAIERIPEYFDALVALSRRPELDERQRRVVHRVTKYLVSPLDLMPEFIYGPTGFREDLLLIAMAVTRLETELGAKVLSACGLSNHDPGLVLASEHAAELDEDVCQHLKLLLEADSVAGDEDLAREDEELTAPSQAPDSPVAPHTMVFAGPGTGKTYRIETELYRLLTEKRVPPDQILVTTFTNKAADELRVRVRQRLQREATGLDADRVLQRLTISTIHAFCLKLIGDFHHHALFLKGTFSAMDDTQRMLFLFRHGIGRLHLKDIYPDWKADELRADGWRPIDLFHFYACVGEIYDFLSEDVMRGAEPALRYRYLELIQDDCGGTVNERIIRTYPRYWRLVQEEGFLDHSMILAYAEALLDDPQVRRRVQATYRHLLVDEYQDTNPIQDRIFRAVAGRTGRRFAVGDDDQSIYAFRGADVRNATAFLERWPGARLERLEENRRSTAALVAATQALIAHNRTRQPKAFFTRNPEGHDPWRVEAAWKALPQAVADLLRRLKESEAIARWDEVGLLFRGLTERVPAYRAALDDRGIHNTLAADRRFLRRPLVKGLLKVLALIHGDEAEITGRKRAHRPFFEALGWRDREKMLTALQGWHRAVREDRFETLLELFYGILNDAGATAAENLLPDLGHLSGFIATAEAQLASPELLKRLGYFLRYAEAAAGSFAGPQPPSGDAVQVMTIHKAKGLEFPVVVVADAVEGVIPAHFPESVRQQLRRELADIPPWLDETEEERRVLYVAMTRAQDCVILATTPDTPSRFLEEFPSVPAPSGEAPPPARRYYSHAPRRAPPLHVHHSQVYDYHFCPKRYLLADGYGFAGQVIAPVRAGQSLHRALEIFHRLKRDGDRVTPDRRRRIFERAWVRPRDARKAQSEYEKLYRIFEGYALKWEDPARRMRVVQPEQPLYVAQGAGVLTGKIDLLRERDDALEIVEYKYHANPMMPDYPQKQLEHYSLAFPSERPRLLVHYLAEDREQEIIVRETEPIRAELDETFSRIEDRIFPAVPEPRRCRLCPVRFACSDRAATT